MFKLMTLLLLNLIFIPQLFANPCLEEFIVVKEQALNSAWVERLSPQHEIRKIDKLKLLSLNTLFLTEINGRFVRNPETGMKEFIGGAFEKKSDASINHMAQSIRLQNADVILLQEAENIGAVRLFNREHLKGMNYHEVVIEGNNEHMQMAFLMKKDLPFAIDFYTHKNFSWKSRSNGHLYEHVFTRDFPALVLRPISQTSREIIHLDPLIIFGVHAKSQRDGNGDPGSQNLANAQFEALAYLSEQFAAIYPNAEILMGGDMNRDVRTNEAFAALRQKGYEEIFTLQKTPDNKRISHTYHPREGNTVNSALDTFWLNQRARQRLGQIEGQSLGVVWPWYVMENGNITKTPIPLPKTFAEREKQPSDHRIVTFEYGVGHLFK